MIYKSMFLVIQPWVQVLKFVFQRQAAYETLKSASLFEPVVSYLLTMFLLFYYL